MIINSETILPLLRIKTPDCVDFFQEHMSLIETKGYVWFCRFGKNNMRIDKVLSHESLLIIKDSGAISSNYYIAKYCDVCEIPNITSDEYPAYYDCINQKKSLWFKVNMLVPLDYGIIESNFVVAATNGEIKNTLRSMCPAFYIRCINKIVL